MSIYQQGEEAWVAADEARDLEEVGLAVVEEAKVLQAAEHVVLLRRELPDGRGLQGSRSRHGGPVRGREQAVRIRARVLASRFYFEGTPSERTTGVREYYVATIFAA